MSKKIRSRYIVEVQIESTYISLIDSNNVKYYIDTTSNANGVTTELINSFKLWYTEVFSKGISQYLTVFEYEEVEHDGQIDMIIKKIINAPNNNK